MPTIKRSLPYAGLLNEVIEHQGTLYLAGIVADALTPDMKAQAEDVMGQLDRLLVQHGSDVAHILQATVYVTDLRLKPAFDEVWKRRLGADHLPARAAIGVADLGPGVLLELVVTAAKR